MEQGKRFRKTQNISLDPDEQRYVREQAERYHGGNVSRYFRMLIQRDQAAGEVKRVLGCQNNEEAAA